MKFLKPFGSFNWYEWDVGNQRLFNYNGGHYYLEENELCQATYLEAKNWHDLYEKTGYIPLRSDFSAKTAWLSPDGIFCEAEAHEVTAMDIVDIIYGVDAELYDAGDILTRSGWLKVTTSAMWDFYLEAPGLWYLTDEQINGLQHWCKYHEIEYPAYKIRNKERYYFDEFDT